MNKNVASVLSVIALVGLTSAAWAKGVPLKGDYAGQAISGVPVDDTHFFVTTVGGGHLTHLGKFTFVSPHLAGLADFSVVGQQILTAANGDTVVGTFDSHLHPLNAQFLAGDIPVTIVGGTGRFANATGSYTFSILFDFVTQKSTATIEGTIDYSGK